MYVHNELIIISLDSVDVMLDRYNVKSLMRRKELICKGIEFILEGFGLLCVNNMDTHNFNQNDINSIHDKLWVTLRNNVSKYDINKYAVYIDAAVNGRNLFIFLDYIRKE